MTGANPGTAVTAESVPAFPLNVKIRNYRGRTLLGGYEHSLELSDTAAFLCRQVDGTRTVRDIGRVVAREFDVDEQTATQDATELFAHLVAHEVMAVEQ